MINNTLVNNVAANSESKIQDYRQLGIRPSPITSDESIKKAIWVYFLLVIFEGALRKWILPGLSTPLLIIRDPVAIYIVVAAWQRKLVPPSSALIWVILIGLFSILTAISLGHGSIIVALFGARILIFHFPLIFIVGNVFTRDDIIKMGKFFLWTGIPMTVLIALQFYSPQSSFVNRGVGDDITGGGYNGGALGYFRPPGTFSFTTGNTQFYGVLTFFVFYFLVNPKLVNRILLIAATACLIAAIPLSISRSMFFQVVLTGVFVALAGARSASYLFKVLFGGLIVFGAVYALSQYSFFQTATMVFQTRLTTANDTRGGLQGTLIGFYLGSYVNAIQSAFNSDIPFLGYGIGFGTNVGSTYLTGKKAFLVAEGEWGRMIGEIGPLLGLVILSIRVSLTFKVVKAAFKRLRKGDALPWIISSMGALSMIEGGWGQPTSLGFFVIICGLLMAAIKEPAPNQFVKQ